MVLVAIVLVESWWVLRVTRQLELCRQQRVARPGFDVPAWLGAALDTTTVVDCRSGRELRLREARRGRPAVLILLSLADCPSCLDELPFWNRLAERLAGRIVAMVLSLGDESCAGLRQFASRRGLRVATYRCRYPERLYELIPPQLGITGTKVLLGPHGRVLCVTPNMRDRPQAQEAYVASLGRLFR